MLEVKDLSYQLHRRLLIKGINLVFEPGILYGILGPNGSGKSTLLKNMSAIWRATSGDVFWNQKSLLDLTRPEISRIVSLVPQSPQPFFDFTVEEMVSMGLYSVGGYHRKSSHLVEEALGTTDLLHLKQRSLLTLSSGERQRVYIARAIITGSPVLLLDEPTSNLDIHHQIAIWNLLKKFVSEGKTVIVTIHDLLAAERYCDKVAILSHGKCVQNGTFREVMNEQVLEEVFGVREHYFEQQKSFQLPDTKLF